jgi:hypothetical protein
VLRGDAGFPKQHKLGVWWVVQLGKAGHKYVDGNRLKPR